MGSYIGILSGRHSLETVCATLRELGVGAVPEPRKGEGWAGVPRDRTRIDWIRVYTDERHYTFSRVLEHPHTLVEMEHTLGNERTLKALVARFGGWVREMGQSFPEPVRPDPDVDNPAYDLRVDLQEALPEEEVAVARALARIGREDPDALERVRAVVESYLQRRPAPQDGLDPSAPSPR